MILYDTKNEPIATVLRIGSRSEGGVWAAGAIEGAGCRTPPNTTPSRMWRTSHGLEMLVYFYIEVAEASPYHFTPPHIWGLSINMSVQGESEYCVREMTFSAKGAKSMREVYQNGVRKLWMGWHTIEPRCYRAGGIRPAGIPGADAETRAEHVLSLINDFIKPLDRGFHGA